MVCGCYVVGMWLVCGPYVVGKDGWYVVSREGDVVGKNLRVVGSAFAPVHVYSLR